MPVRLPARPNDAAPSRSPSPWLMAALLAFVAALVLPKGGPFPYEFEKGHKWNYADLRSPFDFDVTRSGAEAEAALARIESERAPYFTMDMEVARRQKKEFQKQFEAQVNKSRHDAGYAELVANQAAYLNFSLGLLDGLFNQGILPNAAPPAGVSAEKQVFLMKNGVESRVPFGSLLTMKGASDWLTDTLPFSKLSSPEILLPIFENTLSPNLRQDDSLAAASFKRKRDAALKTGISVQKGEIIVARGGSITELVFQKLTSLSNRFDQPNRRFQLLGSLGLAGLASVALALLVLVWFPEKWDDRRQSMLIFSVVLAEVLAFSFLARLGPAGAMCTPMLFLLFFLHQFFQKDLVWMAYLLAVLLTGLSLEWGFGWSVIQFAGGFSLLLFPRRVISWRGRLIVTATATGVMTAAMLGCILAGKFDRAALGWRALGYLWAAALVSLAAFPVANFFRKRMGTAVEVPVLEGAIEN